MKYTYHKKKVDKSWGYIVGGKKSAFYNKFGKGEYPFLVKTTDGINNWNIKITTLTVIKKLVYYETCMHGWHTCCLLWILFI
ncbi:MAG: hypothetical protein GX963_01025 [Bacteroidales bacterium]|nr:hypothetical protein [Bacteroidales bacterium]